MKRRQTRAHDEEREVDLLMDEMITEERKKKTRQIGSGRAAKEDVSSLENIASGN